MNVLRHFGDRHISADSILAWRQVSTAALITPLCRSSPVADLAVIVCLAFDHRSQADELSTFKACIVQCPFVETTMEVSGTYDLIVQGSCASFAEYSENMERVRPHIAKFATRVETNFVSKTTERADDDDILWLPCQDGHRQVQAQMIDKVEAEGDYMRVHLGDWNCLLHETMHRLAERLGTASFIRLHRSSLVRIGFIERLIHHEQRWSARLRDGTCVGVAKSHVAHVLQLINANPVATSSQQSELVPAYVPSRH